MPDSLAAHLANQIPAITAIMGDEPLLVQEAQDCWRSACRMGGFAERQVWTMEGRFSGEDLWLEWTSGSLFGARSAVELRIPTGKPGIDGIRLLEQLQRTPQEDKRLLVTLPALDSRTQQSSWFHHLSQQALRVDVPTVGRPQLPLWIKQRLARQNQQASEDALNFLADCTEGNLLAAAQEIQKLGLLYPTGLLTLDQISAAVMVVSRHSLTALTSALAEGNGSRFALTLRSLCQEGEVLPLILWSLTEDWRATLHLCRARQSHQPLGPAVKEARLWGSRREVIERLSQRVTSARCAAALHQAAAVDRMIKGLNPGDPWETLIQIALDFLSPQHSNPGTEYGMA